MIGEYDESIYYANREATILCRIPEKLWVLNTDRARNNGAVLGENIIRSNIFDESDYIAAKKARVEYLNGKELVVFTNGYSCAYVNSVLLKEFPKDAQFFVRSSTSALRVYYANAFIGIVFPTRFVKEERP